MEALDQYRMHGWFIKDKKYLVKPAVIVRGEKPEDYSCLLKNEEVEEILNMKKEGLPCSLQIAFAMRMDEGSTKINKIPLAEYARMKGFYIEVDEDEIELNPYFEANKH